MDTNQVFLEFYFSKTNPQIESLGIWICKSGFVRIQDSQIWIFKDSFCGIVLKIHEDSLDLRKQVESLKICWIRGQQFEFF